MILNFESGRGWHSNFMTSFSLHIVKQMTLFIILAKLFPCLFQQIEVVGNVFDEVILITLSTLFMARPFAICSFQSVHLSQILDIGTVHPPLVADDVHQFLQHVSYFLNT